MFKAWKAKELIKQKNCKHRWNTVEPYHCFDCGLLKSNYDGNKESN